MCISTTKIWQECCTKVGFEVVQENYPVGLLSGDSPKYFLNRVVRRSLSLFDQDQELVVIAKKS